MKKWYVSATIMVLAVFTMAGSSLAMEMDIHIRKDNSTLGHFLVDDNKMTLYVFKKDTPGKSMCGTPNDCVKKWPVFYAEKIYSEGPMKDSDFATIVQNDGAKQTTYKGMPLYYFINDTKRGDVKGHGVNNLWSVATP